MAASVMMNGVLTNWVPYSIFSCTANPSPSICTALLQILNSAAKKCCISGNVNGSGGVGGWVCIHHYCQSWLFFEKSCWWCHWWYHAWSWARGFQWKQLEFSGGHLESSEAHIIKLLSGYILQMQIWVGKSFLRQERWQQGQHQARGGKHEILPRK